MTMTVLTASIWFIPGWLRSASPVEGVMDGVKNAFPEERVEFKPWDGDNIVWPIAVDSSDKESWRFAFELAMMPKEEREKITLVGHSLGGRIVARVLARLGERGLKVKQGVLLGAAIPAEDPDIAKMGPGSLLPVLAVCNPDDITLRYVYAMAGGEKAVAFGANGSIKPCANVIECVTPANITREVEIASLWAKVGLLKDVANHHEQFYLGFLKRILDGEDPAGKIMVPQGYPMIRGRVMDAEFWWDVLDREEGWKLEKNKVTGHCRILDPDKLRTAWGREEKMRAAFEKVKRQLESAKRGRDGN